jgi:aminoglycoside 3-N-acetyltransferase
MQQMGLRPTDTVLVHTSLRAVGPVEGGADGLIDAFHTYLSEGLFLIPTHTWANVNAGNPLYDVSASEPCIGTLPRIAAFRQDGFRSLHPTHSIWGIGADARSFLEGEENAGSPGAVGFAWDRLADRGAKILLLGVAHNRNTFIHSIDERAKLPDRLGDNGIPVTIIDHEGTPLQRTMRPHFCSRTNDVSQFYVNFEKPLTELGAQTMGRLGNAEVRIVDAKKCRDIIMTIYSRATEDIFTEFRDIPEELYR